MYDIYDAIYLFMIYMMLNLYIMLVMIFIILHLCL